MSFSASLGLFRPTALRGNGGPRSRGFQPALCPACRVWLPSGRVSPSESLSALFHADGARGLVPCGVFPFQKVATRLRTAEPTYRFLPPLLSTKRRAGPTGRGSWALTLPKVPRGRRRLSPPNAGYSRGVSPFQGNPAKTLTRISAGLRSHAYQTDRRDPPKRTTTTDRTRPSVSISPCLARAAQTGKPDRSVRTTLVGFLHRHDPEYSEDAASRAMCSPLAAPCIAADRRRD
jgi:hypothetical protein